MAWNVINVIGHFLWQTHQCLWAWLSCGWWCEQRRSGRVKRLMAAERKSQGNERHNVPVASLPSPPPLSPPLTPTLAVSLCAPGQVRSSGFLARSRDAPIDPRCCGFIKTFPPPSYCVCDCMFVCLSLSLYVSLSLCVIVCVCAFATGFFCCSTTSEK